MHQDVLVAADQILEGAKRRGITVRLLGGAAVNLRCPSASHRSLARPLPDIDLISLGKHARQLNAMFTELGAEPEKKESVLSRIDALLDRIGKETKSLRRKMRAKIGDRMIWYDTPERAGKIPMG